MPTIKSATTASSARGTKPGFSIKDEANFRRDQDASTASVGLKTAPGLADAPEASVQKEFAAAGLNDAALAAADAAHAIKADILKQDAGAYSMMELLAAPEIQALAKRNAPLGSQLEASAALFDKHRTVSDIEYYVSGKDSVSRAALERAGASETNAFVSVPQPAASTSPRAPESSGLVYGIAAAAGLALAIMAALKIKALKLSAEEFKKRWDDTLAGGAVGAFAGGFLGFVAGSVIALQSPALSILGMDGPLASGIIGAVSAMLVGMPLGYYQDTRFVRTLGRFSAGAALGLGVALVATLAAVMVVTAFGLDFLSVVPRTATLAFAVSAPALGAALVFTKSRFLGGLMALLLGAAGGLILGAGAGILAGALALIFVAPTSAAFLYGGLAFGAAGAVAGATLAFRERDDLPGISSR